MREIFCQPYSGKKKISCHYGKPPKDIFKYDVIKLNFGDNFDYMTPDEAATIIRALSAGLAHYLVKNDKCAKAKN